MTKPPLLSKNYKLLAFSYVLGAAILYLMGSFANCSFNIAEWDGFFRYVCSFSWVFFVIFITVIILDR